ncbi:probable E3 ubiquitin-protein ligase makorin-2 [Galendromus occidentalis]|uniref:RING-type E3 ubiquitin transferase n=1 Tax=Galendromus occidentalis TaxID=34638 RepID=A0AAJ6VYY6_9ACAR|nr:probable E3 ubiquitin-protein ligase makorin-2 [Galendromus occidentalis]
MTGAAPRNIMCKDFLTDTCPRARKCKFSHDRKSGISCRYFKTGKCRYGKRCRYDHALEPPTGPSSPSSAAAQSERTSRTSELSPPPLCDFYVIAGHCVDKKCPKFHGDLCQFCSKFIIDPNNPDCKYQHVRACRQAHRGRGRSVSAAKRSSKLQCGVCFEVVLRKEEELSRKFGILENCSHIFCLGCIRSWRRVRTFEFSLTHGCPVCRTESDLVIPSAIFFETEFEKRVLIAYYRAALAEKDCRFFNRGKGVCPFSGQCLSRHALPSGELVPKTGLPRHSRRRYENERRLELEAAMLFRDMRRLLEEDFLSYGIAEPFNPELAR